MSASFLATVLIFLGTGFFSVRSYWMAQTTANDTFSAVCLSLVICTNAVFFLYIELFTETDPATIKRLRQTGPMEWIIRGTNQTLLALIWILLSWSALVAVIGLIVFYVLLLLWDAVVLRHESFQETTPGPYPDVVWHDLVGLLLTLCFATVALQADHVIKVEGEVQSFLLGGLLVLFVINVGWSIHHTPVSWKEILSNRV